MKNSILSRFRKCVLTSLAIALVTGPVWAERLDLFDRLEALDGQSFSGSMTFPDEPDHEMNHPMRIEIQRDSDGVLKIPLQVGDDKSRTWILTRVEDGVLLKHDHRQEDGTPDEITNYGGVAQPLGLGTLLVFPADEDTATMLPPASTNVWTMRLSPDERYFHYYLERESEPRFQATFDLKPDADN